MCVPMSIIQRLLLRRQSNDNLLEQAGQVTTGESG